MADRQTPEIRMGRSHLLRWLDKNLADGVRVEVVEHVPELPVKPRPQKR